MRNQTMREMNARAQMNACCENANRERQLNPFGWNEYYVWRRLQVINTKINPIQHIQRNPAKTCTQLLVRHRIRWFDLSKWMEKGRENRFAIIITASDYCNCFRLRVCPPTVIVCSRNFSAAPYISYACDNDRCVCGEKVHQIRKQFSIDKVLFCFCRRQRRRRCRRHRLQCRLSFTIAPMWHGQTNICETTQPNEAAMSKRKILSHSLPFIFTHSSCQ